MRNKIALFFVFIFFSFYAQSQEDSHSNFWTRLSLIYSVSEKIKIESEFQKRLQNDLTSTHSKDPFQEDLMNSIRLWAHYKYSTKFNFSVSPFAYFQHNSIINNLNDKLKPKSYEVRYTVASDFKQKIIGKSFLMNRLALEYRDFQNNNNVDIFRLRNKFSLRYEFNSKWGINGFDELFLNLNSDDHNHYYDHNRIGLLANFTPSKAIKIEFGSIAISRLPKNKEEYLHENNFLVMLYYTFNSNKK